MPNKLDNERFKENKNIDKEYDRPDQPFFFLFPSQ